MQIKVALVVDDSKSARFSLKKLLEKQGIHTDFAESAGDALNYLETHRPDVIFMDHLMPGMDGFDATRAIKSKGHLADIPVIMCTSKEGSEYAEQAMAAGAYAILPKPAPEATLMAAINQLENGVGTTVESTSDRTAGMLGQRAIETLVRKLLDEQVSGLRKYLGDSLQAQIREEVETTLSQARDAVRRELSDSMESVIHASTQRHARIAAAELFEQRFDELSRQTRQDIDDRFAGMRLQLEALRKPSPELMEEVRNLAQFTAAASAGEAAKITSADVARKVTEDITQKEMTLYKTRLSQEMEIVIQQKLRLPQIMAGAGLLIGICAFVLALVAH